MSALYLRITTYDKLCTNMLMWIVFIYTERQCKFKKQKPLAGQLFAWFRTHILDYTVTRSRILTGIS